MRQLILSVHESKFKLLNQFLKQLDFVKIEKSTEPTKAEILQSIQQGLKEVELIRTGKLPKKPIENLLRDL